MGTDVNPVAWDNAELMAYALLESGKATTLFDYLILFGSILDVNRHGHHSVSGTADLGIRFKVGENEFVYNDKQEPHVEALTKILYEVFYKHQS
ncbi:MULTISPECIES: hypothetical protein [Acinetobacter calcoaceticus/baumannii complex]|uniref:hypothetical protein n=1 Tax=Acinetobacter calcoaceticus/baumannii complex TaxID=909768 RepID=UPI00070781B2|nr:MULTISPECIES: hypothetical protein [Acinetobacter calcoaceticus/baumannii complex]KQE81163.1 hypothetical protein APB92_05360 [Acinetobacter pittii]KRI33007.1 hypothetical protein APB87_18325 [Acinetobacter pittii]MRA20415.1 hypothetical protein [Acinetobacter pittii]